MQQRGDLIMNTVVARAAKRINPDAEIVLGIAAPYSDMVDLFYDHPDISRVHVLSSQDGFTKKDIEWIKQEEFNFIFNPMPSHTRDDWYKFVTNQTEEACLMHELRPPDDLRCYLRYPRIRGYRNEKNVAFFPFAGFFNEFKQNNKTLSVEKAQSTVDAVRALGYDIYHIGDEREPELINCSKINMNYTDSVAFLCGCAFAVGTDTGMAWVCGAYQFPFLGLYSHGYYGKEHIGAIQPINDNSIYLSEENVNDIPIDRIVENIKKF